MLRVDPAVTGEAPSPRAPVTGWTTVPSRGRGYAVRLEAKGRRHFWGNLEGGDDVQEGVLGRGTACQNQSTRVRESGRVMGHEVKGGWVGGDGRGCLRAELPPKRPRVPAITHTALRYHPHHTHTHTHTHTHILQTVEQGQR